MNSTTFLDLLYRTNLTEVNANCIDLESWDYANITVKDLYCLSGTSSSNNSEISAFYFYETEQLAFLWLLFFFIVVGNSAVLLALLLAKGRRSRMNFFITHLAIADLSVGLISVATDIAWKMTVAWHAGNVACKVIRFFQVLVTYSSTYVLIALSIDRCDAITHPMNFCGGWRRAKILVASSWILSAIFSSPILFLYERKIVQGKAQCWIDLQEGWQWKLYMSLVALALFIIPTIIISGCYLIIVYTIWKKSSGMDQGKGPRGSNLSGGGSQSCNHDELEKRVSSRGVIPRAKMKTVKMTFVIVSVFVLCWSPYIIFDLLQVFGHIPNTQTMVAVATFMQSLAPLNSATNPIVYCLFSTRLCRNLRKIPLFDWFARKIVGCVRCQVEPGSSTYQIVKGRPPLPVSRTTSSDPTQSTTMSSSSSQTSRPLRNPPIASNSFSAYRIPSEIRRTPEKRFSRKSLNSDLNCERQRYAKAKATDELVSSLFEFEAVETLLSVNAIGRAPLAEMELSER